MSELIDRQEAIDRFNVIRPVDPKKDEYTKGIDVEIAMCIVAVKDQPTIQPEKAQLFLESATSDLISRQQALNALIYAVKNVGILDADDIRIVFNALPTIQPEPQEGRFERKRDGVFCSVCHYGWEFITGVPAEVEREYHYCPHCGARMKGERQK